MRTPLAYLFLFLLTAACKTSSPSSQIPHLAGYWEISSVTLPNGAEKDFSINTTIEYITLSDSSGTRQKLRPRLDGTYILTGTVENFAVTVQNDTLVMQYHTPFDAWEERVLTANDELLKVKNTDGKIYTYKKFSTFKLTE